MFNLYGDESHFDTAVTYALVVVPENRLFDVEHALTEVKLSLGALLILVFIVVSSFILLLKQRPIGKLCRYKNYSKCFA